MSAERYAEEQFDAAVTDQGFVARIHLAGAADPAAVVVVDESTPVGEVLYRLKGADRVVAVADDNALHGFWLVRMVEV